jgi:DNA-binding LacI/PurR family transcriptional regulator
MQRILAQGQPPTALFAANDRMAIGAIQACYQAGIGVPQNLSVVGLDDIEVVAMHIPPLTTLRQPFTQMMTLGIELLLELIAGRPPEQTQVVLEPKFILRESTHSIR